MDKVTGNTEVTFYVSMSLNGCVQEETNTLEELGWSGEQGKELDEFLNDAFDAFLGNNIDSGWYIED